MLLRAAAVGRRAHKLAQPQAWVAPRLTAGRRGARRQPLTR
jgi:hypothetical protein